MAAPMTCRARHVPCSRQQAPRLPSRGRAVAVKAQQGNGAGKAAAAVATAAMLWGASLAGAPVGLASEFDVLDAPVPTNTYYVDDAGVLSKSTRSDINKQLSILETTTGYRVEVVTVRKLEFETDAFAFADKVLEGWYPTAEEGSKKAVLLVVTTGKEGALTGGPDFMTAIGDDLIDSIVSDNIPIYTEEERYNASVTSSLERIEAKLNDKPVPAAPQREDTTRRRTYKTKEETEKSKTITATVVGTLLVIAVVVPMLQFYGYTARD